MTPRATDGASLAERVRMATPLCQAAQRQCLGDGPGPPPDFEDWQMAVLIMIAILHRRRSKSAQYRWLSGRRNELIRWLGLPRWPGRTAYFDRYRRAHRLLAVAIGVQGAKALDEGVAQARTVVVDKSLVPARGPPWHRTDRKANRIPAGLHGVDRDSTWAFSKHHGWGQGYGYEVVTTAMADGTVLPLLASADTACVSEQVNFDPKIGSLPDQTRNVLADSGYDSNHYGEKIEYDPEGRPTGRHFLCPANPRNTSKRQPGKSDPTGLAERAARQRRKRRQAYLASPRRRGLYARRGRTIEPFNEWFKSLFGLDQRVWHRGLDNNRTQPLAAVFGYQLLLRYNRRHGRENGQVQWILDTL